MSTATANASRVVTIRIDGMKLVSTLNSREHWAKRSRRTRAQIDLITAELVRYRGRRPGYAADPGRLIGAEFHRAYTGRAQAMDPEDNLPASCKALRDAVCRFFGTDDSTRAGLFWRYSQARETENAVTIHLHFSFDPA